MKGGIGDIVKSLLPIDPGEGPPLPGVLKQKWPDVVARALPKIDIEEAFKKFIDMAAPPLPEEIDGDLRKKINDTLAPVLLHKMLPPMPKAIATALKTGS